MFLAFRLCGLWLEVKAETLHFMMSSPSCLYWLRPRTRCRHHRWRTTRRRNSRQQSLLSFFRSVSQLANPPGVHTNHAHRSFYVMDAKRAGTCDPPPPPPPHKILSQSAARKVFGNLARAPVCASGAHHEASVESDPDWCGSNFERYLVNGDTLT